MSKASEWASDRPKPLVGVHERKWEIDSLCDVVRLANTLFGELIIKVHRDYPSLLTKPL